MGNTINGFSQLANLLAASAVTHPADNASRAENANCGVPDCKSDKVCKSCTHFNAIKTTQVDSKLEAGREFA